MMFKKSISKELKKQAVSLGLCSEWTNRWSEKNKDELCQMYVTGIDFCIKNNYPSCQYMKENFAGIMQKHGIFVDNHIDVTNIRNAVCNGKTKGTIHYNGYSFGKLYIRHDSQITVNVSDKALLFIEIYNNAHVIINNTSDKIVKVYQYGGNVQCNGKVIVKPRKLCEL